MAALLVVTPTVFAQDATTGPTAATRPAPVLRFEAPDVATPKVTRTGQPDAGFMRLHNQYVAQAKAGNIDLYMLGDSITDFWQHRHKANWDKSFAGWKAADFGISGDRTQHVLWRLQNGELEGVTPKVIVLLIGTNNLPQNAVYTENTVADAAKGVKAIVDLLKEKEPQAHILLMAVFPRGDKAVSSTPLSDRVNELNGMIANLDDGKQVKFLNINNQLADTDGKLIPGVMMADNLHPSDKGYALWSEAMRPMLTEWLGAPAAPTP
jgi:lysophospholipase L1-like esterase